MANELANSTVGPAPAAAPTAEIPSPFADVVAGKIPAVSLPPIEGDQLDPTQEYVSQNLDTLLEAGLEYLETEDQTTILFNPAVVKKQDLEAAQKDGTLGQLVRPALTPEAPADPLADAQAAGPAEPAPLATATAGPAPAPNRAIQAARLQNSKAAPINTPNPVQGVLSKRAV